MQNKNKKVISQLPILSSEEKVLIEQIIDEIFRPPLEIEKVLSLIEHYIKTLDQKAVQSVLKIFGSFFKAIELFQKGNLIEARNLFQLAVNGFNQIRYQELRDLSIGFSIYTEAIIQFQQSNINQALQLFTQAKKYLRNAEKFSSKFESFIEHMEPGQFYLLGMKAMMVYDFATAKTLIEKASQSMEEVVNKYYKEPEPLYYTYKGIARLYKAMYTFIKSYNEFNQFEYDKLINEQELIRDASQARELLSKGDTQHRIFKNLNYIAEALVYLLSSISELAHLMQKVFFSTFKPDLRTLRPLKKKIRKASDLFSKAGDEAVVYVRMCDQLYNSVNNLERISKPNKKDFGIFSGLVSCASFLPLFLIISWANWFFKIGLEARTIITSSIVLALIGAFGFGALKFKSLIFPIRYT